VLAEVCLICNDGVWGWRIVWAGGVCLRDCWVASDAGRVMRGSARQHNCRNRHRVCHTIHRFDHRFATALATVHVSGPTSSMLSGTVITELAGLVVMVVAVRVVVITRFATTAVPDIVSNVSEGRL